MSSNQLINITGQRFGKLLVIEKADRPAYWKCICDCGKTHFASSFYLRSGSAKSCGCSRGIDEVGKRYGRLVVISRAGRIERQIAWLCRCDCGKETIVRGHSLRVGETRSCGCFSVEEAVRRSRLPVGQAAFNRYFSQIQKGAEQRGYCFELSEEQVKYINSQNCFYCGTRPRQQRIYKDRIQNGEYVYNGIDRIDNSKGYTIDNVVPCCWKCNIIKGVSSANEFKEHVVRIYNHWAKF